MKPGRERVKAWVYTVINPMLRGLSLEAGFLAKDNWTFRAYSRDLEFIRPVRDFVDYQSQPNLDDFAASNPAINDSLSRRDQRREHLRVACEIALDHVVIHSKEFEEEVTKCLKTWQSEDGGNLGQNPSSAVAELIVNNVKELPGHYGYHRFWSKFRDGFMRFREGPEFDSVDRAGFELKKTSDALAAELNELRSKLAEEYDIPWAPFYDESLAVPGR